MLTDLKTLHSVLETIERGTYCLTDLIQQTIHPMYQKKYLWVTTGYGKET